MKVSLTVTLEINLADEDCGDPVRGDPMESRMLECAQEAVINALAHAEDNGFAHDLADITEICGCDVSNPKRKHG